MGKEYMPGFTSVLETLLILVLSFRLSSQKVFEQSMNQELLTCHQNGGHKQYFNTQFNKLEHRYTSFLGYSCDA